MSNNAEAVQTTAAKIYFTLSCLAEGILRARRELAARKDAERIAGLEANKQAHWR